MHTKYIMDIAELMMLLEVYMFPIAVFPLCQEEGESDFRGRLMPNREN